MINEKAIIIKGLSKEYYKKDSSQKGFFNKLKPNKSGQSFYALKDINLEINRGEVIGIIGPNGAGKSTLLKILAEVTPPTSGSVEIFGKVASILEIGIGFQPELSGYENIFLSGQLYGLSKKQILSKLDKIIEMFGFPDFIDTEVKHYSSGMYMRLAFSIIINIEADIYLFDEILSVGDAAFQDKAIGEIDRIKYLGATVLIVTHTPKSIYHFCDNMLLLNKANIFFYGNANDTIVEYRKLISLINNNDFKSELNYLNEVDLSRIKSCDIDTSTANFDLTHFAVFNKSNEVKVFCDQDINLKISYRYFSPQDFNLILVIQDTQGNAIVSQFVKIEKSEKVNEAELIICIPANTFNEIRVLFDILISTENNKVLINYRNILETIFQSEYGIKKLMGYLNVPISIKHIKN
ncbi:MAG: ABC transporter ATP-binding protein [Bacteroidales bacterium]|nr:ABC transporter ATP-binding protein [Bacteroidales bacterium]